MLYVLFIPFHSISLLEMLPIAEKLISDNRYKPLFLLRSNAFTDEDAAMIRSRGMEVYNPWVPLRSDRNRKSQIRKETGKSGKGEIGPEKLLQTISSQKSRKEIKRIIRFIIPELLWETAKYCVRIVQARLLYRNREIRCLLIIGDTLPGFEPAFVKVANKRNIPSIIVPFSLITPMGMAKIRLQRKDFIKQYSLKSWKNRIAAWLFPNWVYEYEGERMLAYPFSWALASLVVGVFQKNPWSICGGDATKVAVENDFVYRHFLQQGVSEKKMMITGKPVMDVVHYASQEENRRQIIRELGLSTSRKILLCAVPQLAEHDMMSWEQHWKEIEFLLSTFSQLPDVFVVLCLHPRSNPKDYEAMGKKYGAIIARKRIYELLPICDVYVATFSTTVMYAVGVGKPTVVVDFYGLGYDVYDNVPLVTVIRDHTKLRDGLLYRLDNVKGRTTTDKSREKQSSEWILLDGKCTERILYEIDRSICLTI
jgi:hypothetical protein